MFCRIDLGNVDTPLHAVDIEKEKRGIVMDVAHFDTGIQCMIICSF